MFNLKASINYDKAMSDMAKSIEYLMDAQAHVFVAIGESEEQNKINDQLKELQEKIGKIRRDFSQVYLEIERR